MQQLKYTIIKICVSIKETGHIISCNNNCFIYHERARCSGVVTVGSVVSEVKKVYVVKVVYRTLFKLAM